jgi:hypothetical protein
LFVFAFPVKQMKENLFMSNEEFQFLNLRQLPVRSTRPQTAWLLNCQEHDIPVLVRERLITPLGNPKRNRKQFFETKAILQAAQDRKWLCKMTDAISEAWKTRNSDEEDSDGAEDAKLAA